MSEFKIRPSDPAYFNKDKYEPGNVNAQSEEEIKKPGAQKSIISKEEDFPTTSQTEKLGHQQYRADLLKASLAKKLEDTNKNT